MKVPRKTTKKLIDKKGVRVDGRKPNELRSIMIKAGVIENADGSAYIEQGRNKILVGVYGPREVHPRHLTQLDRALLRCRYHMAPFSVDERKSPAPSRREQELSKVITWAIEPSVFTDRFPRTSLDVFIEVLEANGGTRCAAITAASVALADAGIPMRDLVAACAAGKVGGQLVLDLMDVEDKMGDADLPVALLPSLNVITLLQMDGELSADEFEKALNLAINGCQQIHTIQREALKTRHIAVKQAVEE